MNQKPTHTHDCDHCIFLGQFLIFEGSDKTETIVDCYFCGPGILSPGTLIGRFGSDGPDYASSEIFASTITPEYLGKEYNGYWNFAIIRALQMGLIKLEDIIPSF